MQQDVPEILNKYLQKLEGLADPELVKHALSVYKDAYEFKPSKEQPVVYQADLKSLGDADWPEFPYNEAFKDQGKMLLNETRNLFVHAQLRDYHSYGIRCNYGTVILPSIFGVKYDLTETSLPWCAHLESREEVIALIKKGIPDPYAGLGAACFETAGFYMETLSKYPKLKNMVRIYHPDFQGPFDVAHLIWGHDLMYAIYDCPELVHELLALITETYISWIKKWKNFVDDNGEYSAHWDYFIKGGVFLRDDSAVMISPDQYEEFVKPYDQKILEVFGGCIHFCGKGDGFIKSMCETKNLYGINCSQPHLNDFELVLRTTREKHIALVGLVEAFIPEGDTLGIIMARVKK